MPRSRASGSGSVLVPIAGSSHASFATRRRIPDTRTSSPSVGIGTSRRSPAPRSPTVAFGSVYLLKGPGSRYKIGRTNAFGRRRRELSIQLPFDTRKVHVIETDDPAGVEAYWHQRFAARRINSEWFELDTADVAAFKRWKRLR